MNTSNNTETANEVKEKPSEVTETPTKATEITSEVTEAPTKATEITNEVTEAPTKATEITDEATKSPADPTVLPTAQPSDDLSSFASGIKTEEDEKDSGTEFVLNGEIEQRCPAIFEAKRADISYGEFTHATYYSSTCGMERDYSILLPADYSEEKKYPVLYLLHGIFGDENSFSNDKSNKIKEIIVNMAADGIIEETILVCPNMYATTDPKQMPGFDSESIRPYDNFINDLINDLMPHIEEKYSVITGRENTYLAGFSMGGRETIYITLQRPELFGYVCAISAAPGVVPGKDRFMSHEGQLSESEMKFAEGATEPNVFIICCGTRDSVVGQFPKQYHELLEANGADHIWYEITGADHDNNAIKSGLFNLFKQIAYDKSK